MTFSAKTHDTAAVPPEDHPPEDHRPAPTPTAQRQRSKALSRGGPILTRARVALVFKLVCASALTGTLLLSPLDAYLGLILAIGFMAATVLLDYWVYRAVGDLFRRLQERNRKEALRDGADEIHSGLERMLEGVVSRSPAEGLEVEAVRADLYRLRDLNNQLIRLGEIAQELNAALPYRETRTKALGLARRLLAADIVALVAEEGGEFTLEGVDGCEAGEINTACCGYYNRCPVRTSFRDVERASTASHRCGMFPPTMRAQLSLPFRLSGARTVALIASGARPGAFDDLSAVVLETLVGHIHTSLSTALKYDRIRREVVTDPLTNLYNRRFFEQRAREEIERSLRHQTPLTLLMVDVDHFKNINDTYGHQTGDHVLQSVAKFLSDSVRQTDICGRYGGEEFVLLLPNTPGGNAVFLADRLRRGIADQLHTGLGIPGHVSVTVSGGVATCPRDATDVTELIRRADEALYDAKRSGRNRIVQAGLPEAGAPEAGAAGVPAAEAESPTLLDATRVTQARASRGGAREPGRLDDQR
ncbi:MAG: diguanylate cyclase [Actinobacteria bacterium]|nr:diguanylate cyclase [Actinomycetota bacterium]